jgi:hypothetical protein
MLLQASERNLFQCLYLSYNIFVVLSPCKKRKIVESNVEEICDRRMAQRGEAKGES